MLGIDKKEKRYKNNLLTICTHQYDHLIFYHYLSQSRIRFNHNFTFWAMVTTAATYARGDSRYRSEHMSYFGTSTTFGTFMKNTKLWREQMDEAIATRLQTLNNIVCCIDNNQKGNTLKNQRYGKSVKYIKVTGC